MAYTLIGSLISPFARKVAVVLSEKGLAYELDDVNPFAPPADFASVSPLGKIPVLRDGDRVVNDSTVICRYLERRQPQPPLYPADPYDCARAEWLEEYIDGGFQPVAAAKVFFPLVLAPLLGRDGIGDDEAAAVAASEFPPFFDYLSAELGESEFLVGESLTVADVTVASLFVNLRLSGVAPDGDRWPGLRSYVSRMHARESFRAVISPVVDLIGQRWIELD